MCKKRTNDTQRKNSAFFLLYQYPWERERERKAERKPQNEDFNEWDYRYEWDKNIEKNEGEEKKDVEK